MTEFRKRGEIRDFFYRAWILVDVRGNWICMERMVEYGLGGKGWGVIEGEKDVTGGG